MIRSAYNHVKQAMDELEGYNDLESEYYILDEVKQKLAFVLELEDD